MLRRWRNSTAGQAFPKGVDKYEDHGKNPFPCRLAGSEGFEKTLELGVGEGALGVDLEFSPVTGKPHILGIASRETCFGDKWTQADGRRTIETAIAHGAKLVGHAVLTADWPIFAGQGIYSPRESWIDTMIMFYALNPDYCSAPGKDEDANDPGSLGLMNLWAMGSQYTNLPQWKACRGAACFGPCPAHDQEHYCAIDAWAGLEGWYQMRGDFPWSPKFFDEFSRLAVYCEKMSQQGIAIDFDHVNRLEEQITQKKAELFPAHMGLRTERCKKETKLWDTPFNPNSPLQVEEWFRGNGIHLAGGGGKSATDRTVIRKALEKELKRLRVGYEVDRKSGTLTVTESVEELPAAVEYLYRVDQYKRSGKGLKAWFDAKYAGTDGLIHPRFIPTGTSTGRLASSRPNFQNIGKIGWASMVRAALIPRSEKLQLVGADKCLAPGTRVLTGDLRWVPVENLKESDVLIGFPEHACGADRRLQKSVVLGTKRIMKPCYELTMKSGTQVVCSADHQWIVVEGKPAGGGRVYQWRATSQLEPGVSLARLVRPWNDLPDYDRGYLSGFCAGEGSVQKHSVTVGQNSGETLDYLKQVLVQNDFKWTETIRIRAKDPLASKDYHRILIGKESFAGLRFLGAVRPQRLFNSAAPETHWEGTKAWGGHTHPDEIASIRDVGNHEVIAVETSTKTFVAEGLLSHNCQLELRICLYYAGAPQPDRDAFSWLVTRANGAFDKSAARLGMTPRDVGKSVAHACLTPDHEVLTPQGWVRIDRWAGEKIAQWDKGKISFRVPRQYHKYEVSEDLYRFIGRGFSQVVTGNHRLPWASYGTRQGKKYLSWHETTAKELAQRSWEGLQCTREPYTGPVYCFTTDTGYFLVRHNGAVSVTGNSNYLEGLSVLSDRDLASSRRQSERKAGALLVYDGTNGLPKWEYANGIVCFTGANLAERLFGDRSFEHRAEALEIQKIYSSLFPMLREWHQAVSKEIETTGAIASHTGRRMQLYGTPEENLKLAAAFLGQGGGADEVQEAMLRYDYLGHIALSQVHDELLFEAPREWGRTEILKFFETFWEPSERFGGIRFPIECKAGLNWAKWHPELNPTGMKVV